MPAELSLQFDGRLSNVSIQYKNPEYIADLVVPPTGVGQKQGKFKKYAKDERFTVPDTKVGAKSKPNEVEWSVTEDTYLCEDHGLEEFLSQEEIDNAESPIQPQSDTVEYVTNLVMLGKEQRIASAVFATGNYTASTNRLDVAGAWATLSTDALSQIEAGIDACFTPPNVMVMGIATWRKLARNQTILAAVKGTLAPQVIKSGSVAAPSVNQQELAEYLGLDAVLIGRARKNTAKKGQAATYGYVWDGPNAGKGGAALIRVRAGAALRDVLWGAQFAWKDRMVMRTPTDRGAFGGEMIRVVECNVFKSIAPDCGYLFEDCLVT